MRVLVGLLAITVILAAGEDVKVVPGGAPAAPAATKPAVPPALTEYMGRRVAPAMSFHGGGASWLLRRMREEEERTSMLMPELRLTPGMTVCDLGSGNGYHSLLDGQDGGAGRQGHRRRYPAGDARPTQGTRHRRRRRRMSRRCSAKSTIRNSPPIRAI